MSEFKQVVKEGAQTVGKKMKRLGRWLIALAIVAVAGYFLVCNFTYSKGSRAGFLTKVTYKGMVFKTYEGTLTTGGIRGNVQTGQFGTSFDFSIKGHATYEALDNLQGEMVKVYYKEKIKAMPWQGKTNYLVYKVEKVQQ